MGFSAKTEVARAILLKNCWMIIPSERVKINMKIIKIKDALLIFIKHITTERALLKCDSVIRSFC